MYPSCAPSDHLLSDVEHRPDLRLVARLGVDAHERFRPGEAHQEPRTAIDEELHAVSGIEIDDTFHPVARELPRLRGPQALHDLRLLLAVRRRIEPEVAAQIEGGTGEVHQLRDE